VNKESWRWWRQAGKSCKVKNRGQSAVLGRKTHKGIDMDSKVNMNSASVSYLTASMELELGVTLFQPCVTNACGSPNSFANDYQAFS
jgi:hypothetical protein